MSFTMKVALLLSAFVGLSIQTDCYFTQTTYLTPTATTGIVLVPTCTVAQCCMDEHCVGMILPVGQTDSGTCIFGTPALIPGTVKGEVYLKDLSSATTCPAPGDFDNRRDAIMAQMGNIECKDILNTP